jgi:Amidohydrolase family
LQGATINAARALRKENEMGSVESGKFADMVILNSNPLSDIHNTTKIDSVLTALPAAFERFNGFYARYPDYILTNPIRNLLALAVIAVAVLIFVVWGLRRLLRRRRS